MTDHPRIIERLLALAERLYADTEGFLDQPGEQQLWYDRGYANGMIQALREAGAGERVAARLAPDAADIAADWAALAWGQAYAHGHAMGLREAREVLGLPGGAANDAGASGG